jgi:hypothetical protein
MVRTPWALRKRGSCVCDQRRVVNSVTASGAVSIWKLDICLGLMTERLSRLDAASHTLLERRLIAQVSDGGNDMIVQLVTVVPC